MKTLLGKSILLLIGLLACTFVMAQEPTNFTTYTDIRYAKQRKDLPENEKCSDRLLDVLLPSIEKPADGFPVVVFIHGGGFRERSKEERNPVVRKLLEQGFAIVSINYYLTFKYVQRDNSGGHHKQREITPEGGTYSPLTEQAVADASTDASLALKWLKKKAKHYGLNPRRVALLGGSAGAMTALHAVYHMRRSSVPIKAVIDLWGALNYPSDIKAGSPALLIVHGDADTTVPVKHAYMLDRYAEEAGIDHEMYIMKGMGHAQYRHVGANMMEPIIAFLNKHCCE